jgi:hypothetical protein
VIGCFWLWGTTLAEMRRTILFVTLITVTFSTCAQVTSTISHADSILLYKIIPEDTVLSKYDIYINGTKDSCFYCYIYSILYLDSNLTGSQLDESCKRYLESCSLRDDNPTPIPDDNFTEPKKLTRKYRRRPFTFPLVIRGVQIIKRKREGPVYNSLRLTKISGPFSIGKSDYYMAILRVYYDSAGYIVIYRIEENSEIYNYQVKGVMY